MIINGSRRALMREFIDYRIQKALEDHSQKIQKKDETFMILLESKFYDIRQDVLSSMEEYLTSDVWNEKDLFKLEE